MNIHASESSTWPPPILTQFWPLEGLPSAMKNHHRYQFVHHPRGALTCHCNLGENLDSPHEQTPLKKEAADGYMGRLVATNVPPHLASMTALHPRSPTLSVKSAGTTELGHAHA